MEILLSKLALKQVSKLTKRQKEAIPASLRTYASSGRGDSSTLKGIKGRQDLYRLRVGNYRAFFAIDEDKQALKVIQILHRSKAYQWI